MGFHGGLMVINGGLIAGKHTKNYGNPPFLYGKIHHKWEFHFVYLEFKKTDFTMQT